MGIHRSYDLSSSTKAMQEHYAVRFHESPRWTAAAPGRVNLIGGHVDYNGGWVTPLAIDRYCLIAGSLAKVAESRESIIYSRDLDATATFDSTRPTQSQNSPWANYVIGVFAQFARHGYSIPPLRLLVHSHVPIGSGLSSSAALTVATAKLLEGVVGDRIDGKELVRWCQQAEHDFAGVPCGIMDPYVALFGKSESLLLIDCRDQVHRYVPFDDQEVSILIVNTNVRHELANTAYAARREECRSAANALGVASLRDLETEHLQNAQNQLTDTQFRRARHVVNENQRTHQFVDAIKRCDWERAGLLLDASHDSLKNDFEVSCFELDSLVEVARAVGGSNGVYGGRMTGGGFGGSAVFLIDADREEAVSSEILRRYREAIGTEATAFITRPANGAEALSGKVPSGE